MSDKIPSGAFLIVNSQVLPLDKEKITIGRGPDNDLVINDPSVSRRHARLSAGHEGYVLSDLDSKCGTFVNGTPIRERRINSGDIIALAGVSILYVDNELKLVSALWEETRPPEMP